VTARTLRLSANYILGQFFLDSLGPLGVVESGDCLFQSEGVGADAGNHYYPGIAAQRVLEQPGQLAVAVGDVRRPGSLRILGEGSDAIAKGEQALVDVDALRLPLEVLVVDLLRSRQVDNKELAARPLLLLRNLNTHLQDGMRSRRYLVEGGRCRRPLARPEADQLLYLLD
jgi:hypothetical protein